MSNRLSPEKAAALATEYCTSTPEKPERFRKVAAMLALGYKPSSCTGGKGLKVYDNPLVKAAIAKIQTTNSIKTGITVELLINELDDCAAGAKTKGDYSTVARCIELKGKTIACWKDVSVDIEVAPKAFTDSEKAILRKQAALLCDVVESKEVKAIGEENVTRTS